MKKKAVSLLLVLLMLCCACITGTLFAAADTTDGNAGTTATVFDFDRLHEDNEEDPDIGFWTGTATLVADESGNENQAIEVVGAYAPWGDPPTKEWTSSSDCFHLPTNIIMGNYKSLYFRLYVSDYTKVDRIIFKFGVGSGYDKGFTFYMRGGATDGVGITKNGWQTIGVNLVDVQALCNEQPNAEAYIPYESTDAVTGLSIGTVATAGKETPDDTADDVVFRFDRVWLGSEEVPENPVLDDFSAVSESKVVWHPSHSNESADKPADLAKDIVLAADKDGAENQAYRFKYVETGNHIGTYNINTNAVTVAKYNAIDITLYIDDIAKLKGFEFALGDASTAWEAYKYTFMLTPIGKPVPLQSGWQTVRVEYTDFTVNQAVTKFNGFWMGLHLQDADTDFRISDVTMVNVPVKAGELETFSSVSPTKVDDWGAQVALTQNEAGENSAWLLGGAGQATSGQVNAKFLQPVAMGTYNAVALTLSVSDYTALASLKIRLCGGDKNAWIGYQFDAASYVTANGWQTVYIPFDDMDKKDGEGNSLADDAEIPTDFSHFWLEFFSFKGDGADKITTDIKLDSLKLMSLPMLSVIDENALFSKDKTEVNIPSLFRFSLGEPDNGGTVSYAVQFNDAPVELTDNKFTPATDGAYTILATVNDESGYEKVYEFTYFVDSTAPAIARSSKELVSGIQTNVATLFTITDNFSTECSVTYAVTFGGEPVTLGENNGLTPQIGTYTFTVTATDNAGNSATETFEVVVKDNVKPEIVLTEGNKTGVVGIQIDLSTFVASVSDNVSAEGAITVTFAVELGISNITLTDGSKFTPVKGGSYSVTVSATDEAGNTATADFTVVVPDSVAPVISGIDTVAKTAVTGEVISLAGIAAKDDVAVNCTLTITVKIGDEEVTLSAESAFTATKAGTYTVTVTASDGTNPVTETFEIVVTDAPKSGCKSAMGGLGAAWLACFALVCSAVLLLAIRRKKA